MTTGTRTGMRAGLWSRLDIRFTAIWLAIVALILVSAVVAPRSLLPSSLLSMAAFAGFLAIASMGESLVIMARGIDLSIPAVITLSSTVLLGVSGGSDAGLALAIPVALAFATGVGFINGVLVGIFRLNALIVTLAVGAITAGATLWYREGLAQESSVPQLLADFGGTRVLSLNVAFWAAGILVVLLTLWLKKTTLGRRFAAVGANPRAAWIAGINVPAYQITAFTVAGLLYGIAGIMVSAFVRNPTLSVGDPYLLAPIAAAVLGGTAITGGIGSMVAVAGAALFLTHLGQMLKVLGLSTAFQFVINGLAIALGMALAEWTWLRTRFGDVASRMRRLAGIDGRGLWAIGYVVGLAVLLAWSRTVATSWGDWLERFQVLIAALIAFGAAVLVYYRISGQAAEARAGMRRRREREDFAARALLPAALGAIGDYAAECTRLLISLLPVVATNQRVVARLSAIPVLPGGILAAFHAAIVAADRENAGQLADLLAGLQVQHARLMGLVDREPDRLLTRGEVWRRVLEAAELHAGVTAASAYARRQTDDVGLSLAEAQITAALGDFRANGHRELDALMVNWEMGQSIYRSGPASG